ncbi:MAG: sporulation protein YlmC with PRC-barrel domain [Spirosomataceae bacterium]|jgi:sporulation protein YlmC with PRC-barrel domain
MKRSINSLLGYIIIGTDGEIGKVEEFYFDDRTSTIRYIIVKTGGWFSEKRVLISPEVFQKAEWESKTLYVNLTQEKIKNSPDIDTEKPVSRQQEEYIRKYYALPAYAKYGANGYWGLGMWGYPAIRELSVKKDIQKLKSEEHLAKDSHLRSTHEVTGYDIHATNGEIGKVDDFIIDDITWKIKFLVVEAGNWFFGKKVLFSPDRIKEIDWEIGAVIIDTTITEVKNSPEYNPELELAHPFET